MDSYAGSNRRLGAAGRTGMAGPHGAGRRRGPAGQRDARCGEGPSAGALRARSRRLVAELDRARPPAERHGPGHRARPPGFGRTPRPGSAASASRPTYWSSCWTTEFDQPVHLFGNSMGGAAAVALAARRPERVASLTLISPALPHPRASASALWFAALATPRLGQVVLERTSGCRSSGGSRPRWRWCSATRARWRPRCGQAYEEELHRRDTQPWGTRRRSTEPAASCSRRWPAAPVAVGGRGEGQCPVLLVYGGRDRLVDAKIRTKAQRRSPTPAPLPPESGHVAQMEHPQEVERAFRQLIR